jgi:D-sedoheptulose 7-phosphate isomerase
VSATFVSSSHLVAHLRALLSLERDTARLEEWGQTLAGHLASGGRLLAAGNGGSAAQAQHLTSELVGRFQGDRPGYSAIALHADTSAVTAIGNDYGYQHVFARQVEAHGRPGDYLMVLSTSGRSENLLEAARTAHRLGLRTLALTGAAPNPLRDTCDEAISVDHERSAIVQEVHLVAVHLVCAAFDSALADAGTGAAPSHPRVVRRAG